jgi:hypothetical protein
LAEIYLQIKPNLFEFKFVFETLKMALKCLKTP